MVVIDLTKDGVIANVGDFEALETAFNIRTIPTLMFCPLDGPREMMIGTMGKLELKQLIQEKLLK